ncbi:hypothetical protein Daus18300_011492 [Diaporthe australafricana]|uniref:Glutathione S-transferase UstS-like C-terminal domain-containing protein n=1 Tax=Diaporthe australafricana TaxID=127596 RepID=A0ABR3W6G6_9PEZI
MAEPITFYDIASGPPIRSYALNFKRVHSGLDYATCWTELTEITQVRKSLGATPCRKHSRDSSDFFTLPIIVDHSTNEVIGDSFQIALYLDTTYPSSPQLFPGPTNAVYRDFNAHVDKVFTDYVMLCLHTMPFNPKTASKSQAEFCKRAARQDWVEFAVCGCERTEMLREFERVLGELANSYSKLGGVVLSGTPTPTYADLIVGGWLWMLKETLPEWDMVRGWQDGLWGRLHDGLTQTYGRAD